jgi:uncharacterized protein (DUF2267 family)
MERRMSERVSASADASGVVETVRHRLGAGSRRDAEATTIIVLRALWERLSIGLSRRLSEILPGVLARRLRGIAAAGTRFAPVETYLTEVAAAGHVSPIEARRQAVAVLAALAEVLPTDVLAQIAAEVPTIVRELFRREPSTST